MYSHPLQYSTNITSDYFSPNCYKETRYSETEGAKLLFTTYTDRSALLETVPLVKFIQNYIWDQSGVFSISASLVRMFMTSLPAFSRLFAKVCLYNKRKITQCLEDINALVHK